VTALVSFTGVRWWATWDKSAYKVSRSLHSCCVAVEGFIM